VQQTTSTRTTTLPANSAERKEFPLATGLIDYSYVGNKQHNPGEPVHWDRSKSMDQADTLLRHFFERGTLDVDGQRHSAKACWRMLAILQLEIEAERKDTCG
jgi:hypothetical protein